ncbi:MAG: hypothetical protein H6505_03125 [Calditrichaeota bacterium]|nr:hypothetical protein [Calditrichota bacterium]
MKRTKMISVWLAMILVSFSAWAQTQSQQEADSLAKLLFGDERTEDQATTLFERGKEDFNAGEGFLKEANAMRAAGTDTTLKSRGGVFGLLGQAMGDTTKSSKELDTRKRAMSAFKNAAKSFEKALAKQPELKEVELWLVATYDRLEDWDKSLPLYREILNERQGEDNLWFAYGYAAYQARQFDKAVTGFDQAMRIRELVTGSQDSIPNSYRLYLGEAYLKTYQDQNALKMYALAQSHATPEDSAEIQKTIDWINWDNGGIAAAEYRDAAYQAEHDERWNDAREAYLGGIGSARTAKAKDFLTWRLSLVTFNHANKTEGIQRLGEVVNRLGPECPKDYSDSYGRMLYAYGQELTANGDRRGALEYFLNSTKIPWEGQGGGYVAIAQIASNDLGQSIENAERALHYPLTPDQRKIAYELLVNSYRSKGQWEEMKKYQALLQGETP